jgi:plastocyanin
VVVNGSVTGTLAPFVPKRAVVWLEGGGLGSAQSSSSAPVRISQHGARFQPDFIVIPAGATVLMPNDDRIIHNVFSVSPPKKFDLGNYPEGDSRSVRFETAGIVDLFCNIHDNMHATIVVTPTRFYTTVSADGRFTIDHVPAGNYRAVVYSRETGIRKTSLTIARGDTTTMNLNLPGR